MTRRISLLSITVPHCSITVIVSLFMSNGGAGSMTTRTYPTTSLPSSQRVALTRTLITSLAKWPPSTGERRVWPFRPSAARIWRALPFRPVSRNETWSSGPVFRNETKCAKRSSGGPRISEDISLEKGRGVLGREVAFPFVSSFEGIALQSQQGASESDQRSRFSLPGNDSF